MAEADVVKKDWWSAFSAYLTPRMLIILAMGFASGLPLLLTLSTLSYWLSKLGVDKTTIGSSPWSERPIRSNSCGRRSWTRCRCRS